MRNVRIFFTKKDRAKYISHLDMTRLFQRAVRRSGIKMWYTEGFHPHLYMSFALPLSLGVESECESVDMKLESEISFEGVKELLNNVLPNGIEVYNVDEPKMKANCIHSSKYTVKLNNFTSQKNNLQQFLERDVINAVKKGKTGEKNVNVKPLIFGYEIFESGNDIILGLNLASGNINTLNPQLLLNVFSSEFSVSVDGAVICRNSVLNEKGKIFA